MSHDDTSASPIGSVWTALLGVLVGVIVAVATITGHSVKRLSDVDLPDVAGEASLVVLALAWLMLSPRMTLSKAPGRAVTAAMVLLVAAGVSDVVDEFVIDIEPWSSSVENLAKVLGVALMGYGIYGFRRVARAREKGLIESREAFERASLTDVLTSLRNRAGLEVVVEQWLRDGVEFAVLVFDLDRFKRLNDEHGHVAGDEALVAFARVLGNNTRDGDVAARMGGDEFVALLRGADSDVAMSVATRVCREFEGHTVETDAGASLTLRASAGFAIRRAEDTRRLLLDRADSRMYAAKRRRHQTRSAPPVIDMESGPHDRPAR